MTTCWVPVYQYSWGQQVGRHCWKSKEEFDAWISRLRSSGIGGLPVAYALRVRIKE